MKIIVAGNTSLTYNCVNKLCRRGLKISQLLIPAKGFANNSDIAEFASLSGELEFEIIHIPLTTNDVLDTDILFNIEWPSEIKLPVNAKLGTISTNLAGQYRDGYLLDIAADMYSGKGKVDVQLLIEQNAIQVNTNDSLNIEPSSIQVLDSLEFELNALDDLRSAKTKAASCICRMIAELLGRDFKSVKLEKRLNRQVSFNKAKVDREIDWHQGAMYLHNMIRAYTHPNPGVITWHDNDKLCIWRGHYFELGDKGFEAFEPGAIIDIVEELGMIVKTGHGLFLVTKIQRPGSPIMPSWVWARQAHVMPSDKFHTKVDQPITV